MALAFIVVGLAAVVFPYRRPELFNNAPHAVRMRVAGFPVISIAGVVTMISWAFVLIAAFSATQFGLSVTPLAMGEAFSVPVLAAIWYLGVRWYRARQGINLAAVFAEIPPE